MSVQVLLPILSALIGAAVGAYVALIRFKKERAFDRSIQWYEQTAEALYRASNTLAVAIHGLRNLADHQNANMVDKAFAEHSAALDGLAVLIWRGELYASQDSFSKLLQITATIVAESRGMSWTRSTTSLAEHDLKTFERRAESYRQAASMLAAEARNRFRLK